MCELSFEDGDAAVKDTSNTQLHGIRNRQCSWGFRACVKLTRRKRGTSSPKPFPATRRKALARI